MLRVDHRAAPSGRGFGLAVADCEPTYLGRDDPSGLRNGPIDAMPPSLVVGLTPVPRETVPSFVSRVAATYHVDAPTLAHEAGSSFKGLVKAEDEAVAALGRWSGLDQAATAELVSWSGKPLGEVRMLFRGETFVSRALRNPEVRGCPRCLREDAERHDGPPLEAMAMRGDWQLRYVDVCVRHAHPLVPLWTESKPLRRFDVASSMPALLDDIVGGRLDRPPVEVSPYDLWLDARLESGRDETALADQTLYAAAEICSLLGGELSRLDEPADRERPDAWRRARMLGFAVASEGLDALGLALDRLTELATESDHGPRWAFGKLYERLSIDLIDDADFAPYRTVLRERILRSWAVGAGEDVLGMVVDERRYHSIVSAARTAGRMPKVIRTVLIDVGAVDPGDRRSDGRVLVDAQTYGPLIEELAHLVGWREMARAMGATVVQFTRLVQAGLLKPLVNIEGFRRPWRIEDGRELSALLLRGSFPLGADGPGWEHIQAASYRTRIDLSSLHRAVVEGALRVGHRAGHEGYGAVFVATAETDDLRRPETTGNEVAALRSVAEFARDIGLRSGRGFAELAADGHTPTTSMPRPGSRLRKTYVTAEDAAAFHARFVTASTLARERREGWRTVRTQLMASGGEPFSPEGRPYGLVYLRSEVERLIG